MNVQKSDMFPIGARKWGRTMFESYIKVVFDADIGEYIHFKQPDDILCNRGRAQGLVQALRYHLYSIGQRNTPKYRIKTRTHKTPEGYEVIAWKEKE